MMQDNDKHNGRVQRRVERDAEDARKLEAAMRWQVEAMRPEDLLSQRGRLLRESLRSAAPQPRSQEHAMFQNANWLRDSMAQNPQETLAEAPSRGKVLRVYLGHLLRRSCGPSGWFVCGLFGGFGLIAGVTAALATFSH